MRDIVKAAKALSDETRLRILSLLLVRECCVCEVMEVLGISQTRASRNLNMLLDSGFLRVRRDGLWAYYSIDKTKLNKPLTLFVEAVGVGVAEDKTVKQDRRHLDKSDPKGSVCCNPLTKLACGHTKSNKDNLK